MHEIMYRNFLMNINIIQQKSILFDYLGVLCICKGLPIYENQGILTKIIVSIMCVPLVLYY